MNSFVLLLYIQRAISEDSSHSSNNYKSRLRPAGRAEQSRGSCGSRVTHREVPNIITGRQHSSFVFSKCLALHTQETTIQFLIITLVIQMLWSAFYSCCWWDWFITDIYLDINFGICKLPAVAQGNRMQHEDIIPCWCYNPLQLWPCSCHLHVFLHGCMCVLTYVYYSAFILM